MSASRDTGRSARLAAAEEVLGHTFADPSLLERALTHPSSSDLKSSPDYERLEFLGDAVLGLIVVEEVYKRFPDLPEGAMTKIKIAVVSGTTLTSTAEDLGIADLIVVGQSERGTGRRGLSSALENVFEALVAALYLDAGIDAARAFILRTLGDRIDPDLTVAPEHPKSALQELVQSTGTSPEYRIVATDGPPHDRTFAAEVSVGGKVVGTGSGRSKKEAEMNAAASALERLEAGM